MSRAWEALTWPTARACRWRAKANGHDYRLTLWLPPGTPPADGFPLLCLLDGAALFGTAVETVLRASRRPQVTAINATAVLAIGHDSEDLLPRALRERDYSWGPAVPAAGVTSAQTGGGPALLSFLLDELLPALGREWPLDSNRRTVYGHSLAGHFVLQALAERPDGFQRWAAISPSIWWDPAGLRQRLGKALQGQGRAAQVLLASGQWEAELPPWLDRHDPVHQALLARRAERDMAGHARALAADLSTWLGQPQVRLLSLPDADHAASAGIGLVPALRETLPQT